jgi:hypothetical protein
MRTFLIAIACALLMPVTPAQERPIPPLKLPEPREPAGRSVEKVATGGIVYARIDATGTQIEARRDLGDRAQAIESISFPVFAPRGASAADVLERSKFYAHVGAVQLEDIAVARAPANSPKPPPGTQIVWFQFLLKDLDPEKLGDGGRVIFRVSYWQPHVGGHFYYLPQIKPPEDTATSARSWNHPIVVRSLIRLADPRRASSITNAWPICSSCFPRTRRWWQFQRRRWPAQPCRPDPAPLQPKPGPAGHSITLLSRPWKITQFSEQVANG